MTSRTLSVLINARVAVLLIASLAACSSGSDSTSATTGAATTPTGATGTTGAATTGTTTCTTTTGTTTTGTTTTGTTTTGTTTATGTSSTASVLCPFAGSYTGTYSTSGTLTATWNWTCSSTARSLSGNGLPNHAVGAFPNSGNPNTISTQTVTGTATLTPVKGTTNRSIGGPGGANVWALNSVKFDPGTAGTCPSSMTSTSNCNLAQGMDPWRIEALGQTTFNFGVDANNAHVQPTGEYHYHGMPEGLLSNAGATPTNPKMVMVGWASDGFPVYARYCYSNATDATSAVKMCTGSFAKDTVADSGRPATSLVPLGAFRSDWTYVAGSGDLDDCNGRTGVTPEFPNGIYYYMATDTYPYMSRCIKGS